ncbi:MAG: hypothetical protein ACRDF4_02680 [Rhabdochlamydiaceae bacterium]
MKSAKHGYTLSEIELQLLREWSIKFHATPMLASKKKWRWIFRQLGSAENKEEDLALLEELLMDDGRIA